MTPTLKALAYGVGCFVAGGVLMPIIGQVLTMYYDRFGFGA